MTVTIHDVAARARVSAATVSRVLNGNYPVAALTRARVLAAVHDLGYIANAHARALIKPTNGVVGVILHELSNPYFAEIVRGIQEVADRRERLVVLCNSLCDPAHQIAYIKMLRGQRTDAVILVGGYIEDAEFLLALEEQAAGLRAQGSRLVLCGHHPIQADAVVTDTADGAYRITRELLKAGHRRIAHLAGPLRFSSAQDRLRGYQVALGSYGIPPHAGLVLEGEFSRDGGYRSCLTMIDSGCEFTAVFAANDLMAIGAIAALRKRGLQVPGDVSLVGFDDIPIAQDLDPPLTTVTVPAAEMGRRSMELALAPPSSKHQIVHLPTEIAFRGSVLPIEARRSLDKMRVSPGGGRIALHAGAVERRGSLPVVED